MFAQIRFRKGIIGLFLLLSNQVLFSQDKLIYHSIRSDHSGNILPWYDSDPGKSYDFVISRLWNFWDSMSIDKNGIPYYLNHQVWRADYNDARGLGGDQIQMALSSWRLLYAYSGDEQVKENMKFLADYYLTHGMSPRDFKWPNIPFPYNTLIYSGIYDGDMVLGRNFTQPDKAGSFGIELLNLHKMMSNERYPNKNETIYLNAAIEIANTLASKTIKGDENKSPLPFKVNALTGDVGKLLDHSSQKMGENFSSYTTNWAGLLELFLGLIELKVGNVDAYQKSFDMILNWMKKYPMNSNKWGPFFEDIPGWSDTQINAMTWARFIMNHPEMFPNWKSDVLNIFKWVYKTLGNDQWKKYGVTVINEQTAYQVPGNSHTSRQAADELYFASLTGDNERVNHAIRQLNWATYMVDFDGKNRYPQDGNWLTDGYGDYIRHYLRAMAAYPLISPKDQNHILSSTSVIQQAGYAGSKNSIIEPLKGTFDLDSVLLHYSVYDKKGNEIIRLQTKPGAVFLNGIKLTELTDYSKEGYFWKEVDSGGILSINRTNGNHVVIMK
jgi:hypothetical protein